MPIVWSMNSCPNCGADLQVTVVPPVADEQAQLCQLCEFGLLRIWVDRRGPSIVTLPPLLRDEYESS